MFGSKSYPSSIASSRYGIHKPRFSNAGISGPPTPPKTPPTSPNDDIVGRRQHCNKPDLNAPIPVPLFRGNCSLCGNMAHDKGLGSVTEVLYPWKESEEVLYYDDKPYIPETLRTLIMARHHDDRLAGHFGIEKTQKFIIRKFHWDTLKVDVEKYVNGCDICMKPL